MRTIVSLFSLGVIALFLVFLASPLCGCSTRETAYHAAMKSDLKNLASQQEIYFSDYAAYSDDFRALSFVNSDGVIVTLTHVGAEGWSAEATHLALRDAPDPSVRSSCAISWGNVPERPVTTVEGFVSSQEEPLVCDRPESRRSWRYRLFR